jgi:dihydroorotase-like cyclic amidohydrolase
MVKTIIFQTNNFHLSNGEVIPALISCTPGQPLEYKEGIHSGADIQLPNEMHVAIGRADPHVHFRESYLPSREEFEHDPFKPSNQRYEDLELSIKTVNRFYSVSRGSYAALKGGVWLVGAMGNTPWAPLGSERWKKTAQHYQKQAYIFTHVWPRIEPGIPRVEGQEEKDFGSTFGGTGITGEQRRQMYLERQGGMISYHNDKERSQETIEAFKNSTNPPDFLLHPLYYNGDTVLEAQRETINLAKEAKLKRLLTRHVPTGPGLDMILQERGLSSVEFPAEIGLDYLFFNRDMLENRETRSINYRRPALPAEEDQSILVDLTRQQAQKRDPLTFIGSDHAPHPKRSKAFNEKGLPGSPGTRVLEHTHQIHMNLVHQCGFSMEDIDWLTGIVPAKYIAQYRQFPYPVGIIENGAMANLVIYNADEEYSVDEAKLGEYLNDPEYHTAYRDESLQGKVYYTIVNGIVYDVKEQIQPANIDWNSIHTFLSDGLSSP